MFEKFNWGHGIALFYVVFVGVVITALVASFGVDHTLVEDDYYAKDLSYQNRFDKMSNSLASDNLKISVDNGQVQLLFLDSAAISGSVYFYRASDKSQDFTKTIDSHKVLIPVTEVSKGKWSLKVDWKEGDKSFYKEEVIFI